MIYLRKIFNQKSNRLLIYIDQAIISGSNFLIAIVLTRLLGIESYGQFALIWMITFFFSSIQQSLLIAPLYTLSNKYDKTEKFDFHNTLKGLQNILSLISFGVSLILLFFLYYPAFNLVEILVISLSISGYLHLDFYRRIMFLKKKTLKLLILDCIYYPLSIILLIVTSELDSIQLFNHFFNLFVLSVICLSILHKELKFSINIEQIKRQWYTIWEYSKFLIYTSLLQFLTGNLFLILTGTILSSAHLGTIRICQNIMGVLHILFNAFENYIPIKASREYNQHGYKGLKLYYHKLLKQTGPLILLFCALIAIFNTVLLDFIYNVTSQTTSVVLMLFSLIYIFIFVGTLQRFFIRTIEKNKIIFRGYLIATIISLIICFPIVTHFGVIGATIGLLVTQITYVTYYQFMINKSYD